MTNHSNIPNGSNWEILKKSATANPFMFPMFPINSLTVWGIWCALTLGVFGQNAAPNSGDRVQAENAQRLREFAKKKIISILAAVFISPLICQSLHAEDADRKLKEAIKVISNPETHSRPKHEAMVTLQELKDVRSIDALYEQIDFASNWGNPLQKGTTNTYPATNALIVIGLPSIKGAERFVSSGRSLNKDQLWLTTYVVGTIFQISTKEEPGSQYPKAREMTLEWIKKNFTVPQMKKAAERDSPDLEAYLATLPDD